MMDCFKQWHSHYICDIWHRDAPEVVCVPAHQIEINFQFRAFKPDYHAARVQEARAWAKLNEALEFGLLGYTVSISVHGRWLRDVREAISGEFYQSEVFSQAHQLEHNLRTHNIYDGEVDDCRAVLDALYAYAHAMERLFILERKAYKEIMNPCSSVSIRGEKQIGF
jgi:hypothetical protein